MTARTGRRSTADAELAERAASLGVAVSYVDVDGHTRHASPAAVRAVCEILAPGADRGIAGTGGTGPQGTEPFDEVVLVRGGVVAGGVGLGNGGDVDVDVVVELEDGDERPLGRVGSPHDLARAELPIGLHRLRWTAAGSTGRAERTSTLLVAPGHFARPGGRRPGRTLFAPAYALWSHDEPLPSYDGLGRLGRVAAPLDIGTIATLPLYAPGRGDRFEASPYSPLSRFHWNELLIPDRLLRCVLPDPAPTNADIDDWVRPDPAPTNADIDDWVRPDPAPTNAAADRARVDWARVRATRWGQLEDRLQGLTPAERHQLDHYLLARPDVVSYARYAAAGDASVARLHELGQWLAERALGDLAADFAGRGQQLALDLPVGARIDSWETATWPHLFTSAASIGAPPDTFFAGGQIWGLPPLIPTASRRDGHRVWHDLLETACRYAGVLRIDHAMQVHRLWWVPEGHDADDGVYVHYPADELLAVAAIVAHRTGTTMIGEDLGTVPPEVSRLFADWHLSGMYEEVMAMHELAGTTETTSTATSELPTVPAWSWAGIRTHDMPALAATAAVLPTERYRRALAEHIGRPVGTGAEDLAGAMVERLLDSEAADVVVDLDDVLGVTASHNVPGIIDDDNWTRRLDRPVEALADEPALARVLRPRTGKAPAR